MAAPRSTADDAVIRRRQPPGIRREMLLQAARAVIAERGLHAATIRDVATAGNVAVGTVTYHFSGIAEVLAGVLEAEMREYSDPIMAAARDAPTGKAALECLIHGLMADGPRARDHWKLWLDFWALSAHDPLYARWQSQVYAELHDQVAAALHAGAHDGSLPHDSSAQPPLAAAIRLIALLDGLVVQCYLPRPRVTLSQARSWLLAASLTVE